MNPCPETGHFRLRREFSSRIEEVDAVCREIRSIFRQKGLDTAGFALEVVARECLNNAVLHGNGGDAEKRVVLRVLSSGTRICLQVADQGPGFDWRKEHARPPADPDAAGGRGLSIIHTYADRVHFNRSGNQITLWLRRPAHETQEES